ncbi:hypothetical protein P0D88_31565 [Paraburkholderia sp. RL18-103-BIB-C]|uniref:hypothetical protein n=1 Tax=Paraburkholderia sp. RL18-103-BIB-C TaxID=3031637 RepID=UPI0038BC9727
MTDGKTDCNPETCCNPEACEADETSRADLLMDEALLARATQYAQTHGMSIEQVLIESVQAFLDVQRTPTASDGHSCTECSCVDHRRFPSGRDACIVRSGSSYAILADITPDWYGDRWCYDTYERARLALEAWDGGDHTEPQGWSRHPNSGRRRPDGDASKETQYW